MKSGRIRTAAGERRRRAGEAQWCRWGWRRPRWEWARLSRRSARGLGRRSRRWAAAVAAAPWQSRLRSWPARSSEQAGGGRRWGGWRCTGARRGRRAGQGVGGARGRPRGYPDEPVVHGEQHGGQGHTQEVGADRGKAQPSAAGTLAQPRTARALATAAHTARAPHRAAHSTRAGPAPTPGPPPRRSQPRPRPPHANHAPCRATPPPRASSPSALNHRPRPPPAQSLATPSPPRHAPTASGPTTIKKNALATPLRSHTRLF